MSVFNAEGGKTVGSVNDYGSLAVPMEVEMRLTSRGRHAVSAMVDLRKSSQKNESKPITLASIAERQFISLSYLEQLFRNLRENGLVRSVRGPGGGYFLNKDAAEITVADIVRAVNEPMHATVCENAARGCHRGHRCDTHQLWRALEGYILCFMEAVTLQQIVDKKVVLDQLDMGNLSDYMEENMPAQKADINIEKVS
ncbi:MAG: Rrf2 family transcriptional regulator [Mariprofundaceae bacterium]|nr:Rrf2 family transcriptional regulator [Mariprofundaceae bacterium]